MNNKPVAVITGASRGIGRSVAIALAAEGYDIAAIARSVDSEGMENLGPEVEKKGAQFFPDRVGYFVYRLPDGGCFKYS